MKAVVPAPLRPMIYAAGVGIVLTALFWFAFPLVTYAAWIVTLGFIGASLIGMTIVGIVRLAQRFANPS